MSRSRSAPIRPLVAIGLATLSVFAATATAVSAEVDLVPPAETLEALSASDVLWDSPIIEVCWEANAFVNEDEIADYAWERMLTRSAAEQSWEAESNVDFVGWAPCSDQTQAVRIGVGPLPIANEIGRKLAGVPFGIEMPFGNLCGEPGDQVREWCIRDHAVHEFGHVLGFTHEHFRTDQPEDCEEEADSKGTSPVFHLTEYDDDSVMNYCGRLYSQLTPLDLLGVRRAYGPWNEETFPTVAVFGQVTIEEDGFGPSPSVTHTFQIDPVAMDVDNPTIDINKCVEGRVRVIADLSSRVDAQGRVEIETHEHLAVGHDCSRMHNVASTRSEMTMSRLQEPTPLGSVLFHPKSGTTAEFKLQAILIFPADATSEDAADCSSCVLDANNTQFADPVPSGAANELPVATETCGPAGCDTRPAVQDTVAEPIQIIEPPRRR